MNIASSLLKTLAYGWHLQRGDGVSIGFTSHDKDQIIDEIALLARPGMVPTKIVSSLGTQSDGLDINGAITDDALREGDLQDGRWDAARIHIFLYDWNDPTIPIITLVRGQLGEVGHSDGVFTAELLGLTASLDHEVAPVTSPNCRARFGDHRCKLNQQRFAHDLIIARIEGDKLFIKERLPGVFGGFAFGEMRWLNGPATGLSTYILDSDSRSLSLVEIPLSIRKLQQEDNDISALNLRIEAIMGCDKSISTCSNRFRNSVNFRGEPYLPGNDLLTRYPGVN